jgi:predicted nucleic acid-binding protein
MNIMDEGTLAVVRAGIMRVPSWLEVRSNPGVSTFEAMISALDDGESAAIRLAGAIGADLLLMDDRDGVAIARAIGFAVTGTLGVLDLAAHRGLINHADAFTRLKATNFHYRQGLLDALLSQQSRDER